MSNAHGSKWIRKEKRLAIYLRDGLACVYCGRGLEDVQLTLDHVIPRSQGGLHEATNLVTACTACNSARHDRPVEEFVEAVALYINHDISAADILTFVHETRQRKLNVDEAKKMIARRGGYTEALHTAGA